MDPLQWLWWNLSRPVPFCCSKVLELQIIQHTTNKRLSKWQWLCIVSLGLHLISRYCCEGSGNPSVCVSILHTHHAREQLFPQWYDAGRVARLVSFCDLSCWLFSVGVFLLSVCVQTCNFFLFFYFWNEVNFQISFVKWNSGQRSVTFTGLDYFLWHICLRLKKTMRNKH